MSTSLPKHEPSFPPAPPYRRMRRRPPCPGRGLVAVGLAIVVVLVGVGAFLFYENTLPTTLTTNFKSGQKDVPTDSRILLTFSRPVTLAAVQAAFSINPGAAGAITSMDGQTSYSWSPTNGLHDLTTYTVTTKPLTDVRPHPVHG